MVRRICDLPIAAMMAPERLGEAAAATVARSVDLAGEPQSGSRPIDGRAPLRWPFTSRAQQERALQAAAEAAGSETTPESSEASEDERKNTNGSREIDEQVDSESGESLPASPSSAQAAGAPAS